jgi:hypothetical protein
MGCWIGGVLMSIMHFSTHGETIWWKGIVNEGNLGTQHDVVIDTAGQNARIEIGFKSNEVIYEWHRWRNPNPQQQNTIGDWLLDSSYDTDDFEFRLTKTSGNTVPTGGTGWRSWTSPIQAVPWRIDRNSQGTNDCGGYIEIRFKGETPEKMPRFTFYMYATVEV